LHAFTISSALTGTVTGALISGRPADRYGRRPVLFTRTFYAQDFSGIGLLVYLLMYIIFFGFSTGAVIWVLIAEIFPNRIPGKGQSFGSFTHWFFAALITLLFPVIARGTQFGVGHAFMFFSIMMIIQAIVVWKYFPETKGRTLEDLGENL
jgi:MFS family permease